MTLPAPDTYPIAEAMKAMAALRNEAQLPAETFPLPAVIGMLSDEIAACRKKGKTDDQIASLISHASAIKITGPQVTDLYATADQRGKPE